MQTKDWVNDNFNLTIFLWSHNIKDQVACEIDETQITKSHIYHEWSMSGEDDDLPMIAGSFNANFSKMKPIENLMLYHPNPPKEEIRQKCVVKGSIKYDSKDKPINELN